ETLVARKSQAYARLTGTAPALVAGAAAFVRAASSRVRMGLVSGAQRREIEPALARAGLADRFEVILAGGDVARCQPDPAGCPPPAPRRPTRARQRVARARHGALHRRRVVARRRRTAHAHGPRSRDVRPGAAHQ